jgi:hypothetical protein
MNYRRAELLDKRRVKPHHAAPRHAVARGAFFEATQCRPRTAHRGVQVWEKQALSARGFKRVGRHSEYPIYTVWRCIGRVQVSPLNPVCVLPGAGPALPRGRERLRRLRPRQRAGLSWGVGTGHRWQVMTLDIHPRQIGPMTHATLGRSGSPGAASSSACAAAAMSTARPRSSAPGTRARRRS